MTQKQKKQSKIILLVFLLSLLTSAVCFHYFENGSFSDLYVSVTGGNGNGGGDGGNSGGNSGNSGGDSGNSGGDSGNSG
ncbi:hypothetical protein ACFLZH_02405, partial [Patescibacteria group bacterium]